MKRILLVCLAPGFVALSGRICVGHPTADARFDTDARIQWCLAQLQKDPRLYPVLAELGAAYFEKARSSGDPADLARARESLKRSHDIQPSLAAQKSLAAISNYAHRFEDALTWAQRARQTDPQDSSTIAMMVEAHLALGDLDAARQLLESQPGWRGDFYLASAMGQYLKAFEKPEEAAGAFEQAASLAESQNVPELRAWSLFQAAQVHLDGGQLDPAELFLARGAALGILPVEAQLLRAALLGARGKPIEELAIYEELLHDREDAEIHARAGRAAQAAGNHTAARRHFVAAEAGFQKAIDAGEVYTVGALSRLYLDFEVHLDRALKLCEENLRHQRDRASRELCGQIRSRLVNAQP